MKFRYARHTNNLEQLKSFYTTVLKLEILGAFEDHNGYDGVFLGLPNENWHLEFTQNNKPVNHVFDEDDLLVFYPESKVEFDVLIERISQINIQFIKAKNPYWNENGKLFLDPDGHGIVISNLNI